MNMRSFSFNKGVNLMSKYYTYKVNPHLIDLNIGNFMNLV